MTFLKRKLKNIYFQRNYIIINYQEMKWKTNIIATIGLEALISCHTVTPLVFFLQCHGMGLLIIGQRNDSGKYVLIVVISSRMNHFYILETFLFDLLFELSLLALKSPVRKHKGGNSRHRGWKVLV